jgi:hypothetical protein
MYFFLIVVGFFHGFIILPIVLSMINLRKGKSEIRNPKINDYTNSITTSQESSTNNYNLNKN